MPCQRFGAVRRRRCASDSRTAYWAIGQLGVKEPEMWLERLQRCAELEPEEEAQQSNLLSNDCKRSLPKAGKRAIKSKTCLWPFCFC